MEAEDKEEESKVKLLQLNKRSSKIDQHEAYTDQPKNVLRSCFKGTRAKKNIELHKITL